MKFIKPQNSIKNLTVEDSDFERLVVFKWWLGSDGHPYRHEKDKSNKYLNSGRTRWIKISMPNEIFETRNIKYDHRDRNPQNNSRINLRVATSAQNQQNKSKVRGQTSIYKGVSWHSKYKKWRSAIYPGNKHTFLGHFSDEILAAIAYDDKAIELYGEFAHTNFPLAMY